MSTSVLDNMLGLGLLFQSLYKQNDHMMELWEEAAKSTRSSL